MADWPTVVGDGLSVDLPINFGSSEAIKDATDISNFGDGYTQRVTRGLNSVTSIWTVKYNAILNTDVAVFKAFLVTQGYSRDVFNWTPPTEAVSKKWTYVKDSWKSTPSGFNSSSLTLKFKQEFDL